MAAETKALPSRGGDPLHDPAFVIICGKVGVGKSTEAALSFPNSYYVQTNDKNIRSFMSYVRDHPDKVIQKPTPFTLTKMKLDRDPKSATYGQMLEVNVERQVRLILDRWCRLTAEGRNPYDALIFDEWSTISAWIYEQMPSDVGDDGKARFATKSKGDKKIVDQFAVIAEFKRLHALILQVCRATQKSIVLISHLADPKYQDDPQKPHYGEMLYPGGPSFPIGTLIRPVCAEADVVVHLVNDGTGGRQYLTQPDERWERKFRDFKIKPEEPIGDEPGRLREMLIRAGFPV